MHLYYFGSIGYWGDIVKANHLEFNTNQSIPKKSYTNRCTILTANGLQSLSIPIDGGRGGKIPFNDIKISYTDRWIEKHKMAYLSAYSKSPFYEYYMPYFQAILDRKYEKLIDLNLDLTKEILRILKLNLEIELIETSQFSIHSHIPESYKEFPPYPQVFRYKYDFQPDLSILDLLFNLGNKSLDYLKQI